MEYFDLEELFMQHVREVVTSDKDKFSDIKVIEKHLMEMYLEWVQRSNKALDGFSPMEYVAIVDNSGNLFDYIEYILNTGRDVSDIVTDRLVANSNAVTFVKKLLASNDTEVLRYAFMVLFELGGDELTDACINILKNGDKNEEKVNACYEFLATDNENAVQKILDIMYEVDEDTQFLCCDILSHYKDNDSIYMWLITMLYRGKDLCEVANMLARFGDKKAVNIINSYVLDKDLNYSEFIELRNAVESLGGDFIYEKDFTDDEYYKLIVDRKKDNNSNND